MIDHEYSGSISTRKLVIETAKFNVLTAYTAAEAIETFRRFPSVDGIVADPEMPEMSCTDMVRALKKISAAVPVVLVGYPKHENCEADYQLESFDPRALLVLLQKLRPKETLAIEKRNETLKSQE